MSLGISMRDYRSDFRTISGVDRKTILAMAELYLAHYDGSSIERFETDLASKTEVLLVYSGEELIGFTTLELYEHHFAGQCINIVYSGDTIVHPAHWGQQTLAFAWISRIGQIKRATLDVPMYWFLIVKGHRTFKFLPAFAKSFYPHWEQDRSDLRPLLDQLAKAKFGDKYNSQRGLVEYTTSHGHLKSQIAEPSPEELTQPAVALFLKLNPRFREGHELCCLCEIKESNMRPLTLRLFRGSRT
jgi:hypothetical protein